MKKTISLILCFAMILSTVAFAMPAFAESPDRERQRWETYIKRRNCTLWF